MVNRKPLHDPDKVRSLAEQGTVHYASTSVEIRASSEGFSYEDVCKCITQVSDETYRTTLPYKNSPSPFDVHLCTWKDKIVYLKLKLSPSNMLVVVGSFHESDYSS